MTRRIEPCAGSARRATISRRTDPSAIAADSPARPGHQPREMAGVEARRQRRRMAGWPDTAGPRAYTCSAAAARSAPAANPRCL